MLTISIIFALLVALWGFSGTLVSATRRSLDRAKASTRTAPQPQTRPARTRGTRPVASA
jgi:hypothetical protein